MNTQEFEALKKREGLFDAWEMGEDVRIEETDTEIRVYPVSEHATKWIGSGQHLGFMKGGFMLDARNKAHHVVATLKANGSGDIDRIKVFLDYSAALEFAKSHEWDLAYGEVVEILSYDDDPDNWVSWAGPLLPE